MLYTLNVGRAFGLVIERLRISRFDSRTGNASLYPWERHVTLISHWVKQSTRFGGPALRMTCKQNPRVSGSYERMNSILNSCKKSYHPTSKSQENLCWTSLMLLGAGGRFPVARFRLKFANIMWKVMKNCKEESADRPVFSWLDIGTLCSDG